MERRTVPDLVLTAHFSVTHCLPHKISSPASLSFSHQVCPISGKPLTVEDLTPDTELRKKIMRRHIATSMGKDNNKGGSGGAVGSTTSAMADDLYDF